MSYKVRYLDSHLNYFLENLGNDREEHFHQTMREIEKRYRGRWDRTMLPDYCWSLKREEKNQKHQIS